MQKSVVLLSGGLDSTVSFKKVIDDTEVALTLTFDYGQRAAKREIEAASAMSRRFRVNHEVIELPWLKKITGTALVDKDKDLPELKTSELDTKVKTVESAKRVWVPNRNGVFINIAAAYCEAMGADMIVTGFNAEEAATFPDNSPQFIDAINASLGYSTLSKIKVISPTSNLNKVEIVRLGMGIDAPLDLMWSCYEGGKEMCGRCESCLRLKRGLEDAGSGLAGKLFEQCGDSPDSTTPLRSVRKSGTVP